MAVYSGILLCCRAFCKRHCRGLVHCRWSAPAKKYYYCTLWFAEFVSSVWGQISQKHWGLAPTLLMSEGVRFAVGRVVQVHIPEDFLASLWLKISIGKVLQRYSQVFEYLHCINDANLGPFLEFYKVPFFFLNFNRILMKLGMNDMRAGKGYALHSRLSIFG